MGEVSSTTQLKRVLGRGDLMSIAVGQIIGAGIMALTGSAIGITGKSVNLAFLISAVLTIIVAAPQVILGGTVRLRGGTYSQVAMLAGKKFSGVYIITYVIQNISIAMYCISFADYFLALVPIQGINPKLIAVLCLTLFYLLNLFGIQGAAKIQNLMVVLMAAALAAFTGFGLFKLQPGMFSGPDFMPQGAGGLFTAASLLAFATGGATVVINFGAEAKNPTKDFPYVIILSTVAVAALYALMSTVAANVLPIDQVANKPLNLVAKAIMPTPLYVFFMVGGAMFALTTTLNATLGWVTKPIMQACDDGWFPAGLAKLNKQKTPYVLLSLFFVVGLLPILFGWNIAFIAKFALVLGYVFRAISSYIIVFLPKAIPEIWNGSKFKTTKPALYAVALLGTAACCFQGYLLGKSLSLSAVYGNIAIFVVAIAYALIRDKTGKVNMKISYEAA